MELQQVFRRVAPSIVAFGSKIALAQGDNAPPFPSLIGTGFFIDHRGIVVTNRHIVEALVELPPHPKKEESSAFALVYSSVKEEGVGHALSAILVDIVRADMIDSLTMEGGEPYYGDPAPDIAFVQLKVRDVPVLPLATKSWTWAIGMDIATAGFAMGTDALAIYGTVNSVTPLLRRGIVSSLFPFPCPTPHGFTIDIASQGGQSGSPIFLADKPIVIGLLHAGFENTNITIAVTSLMVAQAFKAIQHTVEYQLDGIPTLTERLAQVKKTDEPMWERL